eukprot:TRINITY_DN3555_c0_g3_i1.p1 TRINITY_DN3555_c0_g3~~TRINITY_DN3555_c0_g3_i1.p1  ORF type:complete len:336 (+),score=126.88 TRINITY_DN3555_c0_g3_i1:65-1072(+)
MSDSSSDSEDIRLFCEKEEYSDVAPLPQADAADPVVAINYSEEFADCHGYLRAFLASGEKSARVLEVTSACIRNNPANYTAWKHRRDVLLAIKGDIKKELKENAALCSRFAKNFQIWHHRRELLAALGDHNDEKEVAARAIANDSKNYHVWSHRKWVATHFDLLEGEAEYAAAQIEVDFRNNSAWSYMYFVAESRDLGLNVEFGTRDVPCETHVEVRRREILRALTYLPDGTENEAVHNYILGHLLHAKAHADAIFGALAVPVERAMLEAAADDEAIWPLATLAEVYTRAAKAGDVAAALPGLDGMMPVEKANELYVELAKRDPVRRKYWTSLVV